MSNLWSALQADAKDRQRRAITRAAVDLLGERGVTGISMTALAEKAEISRQTLYKYFSSVEEAIVAYLADEIAHTERDLWEVLSQLDDPFDRLDAFVRLSVERFNRRDIQLTMETAMSPQAQAELSEALRGIRAELTRIITDGFIGGMFRSDIDPDATADMFFCMIGGTAQLVQRGEDPEVVAQHCSALLAAAIRA